MNTILVDLASAFFSISVPGMLPANIRISKGR